MRRSLACLAGTLLLLGGCSSGSGDGTPAACLEGSAAFLGALADAPQPVSMDGGVPISSCLKPTQTAADLGNVGQGLIEAATNLNESARRDPSSADSVRLGYLVGAVKRGESGGGGIHADLVRRLEAAARFTGERDVMPAEFERAYGRGYAAGRRSG